MSVTRPVSPAPASSKSALPGPWFDIKSKASPDASAGKQAPGRSFVRRAYTAVQHQLRTRAPRLSALLSRELPLRSVPSLSVTRPRSVHAIPNVIYQTWGSYKFGRTHARLLSEFRALNDDFSFQFFDDRQLAEEYMAEAYKGQPILDIFNRARFGPMKADIWRYCIVFDRGGFYCDINKSVRVRLRDLLAPDASGLISFESRDFPAGAEESSLSAIQHPDKVVMNWMFGFAPGHRLLAQVIDGIVAKYLSYKGRVVKNPKREIIQFTGPEHLTRCLHEFARTHGTAGLQQAGIDFDGNGVFEMAGSYVRYIQRPSYEVARDQVIVA